MKLNLKLSVVMLTFLPLLSFSQERKRGEVEISPTLGLGISVLTNSDEEYIPEEYREFNHITSLNGGIGLDVYLNNKLSIRSGMYYQRMGTKGINYEKPFNGNGYYVRQEFDYLTIPLHLNFHFGGNKNWNVYGGPSFGLTTRAKSNQIDIKYYMNEFQMGAGYGIGYKFAISEKIGIAITNDNFLGLTYAPKNVVRGDGNGNRTNTQQKLKNMHSSINAQLVIKL